MREALRDWGSAILRAAVILLLLYYFCWPVRLMGSSMEPTMGDGEIVLMSRFAAQTGRYQKGDIVIFAYHDADGAHTVVKRVIATAGDSLRIAEDGVQVNGELLREDYAVGETYGLADFTIPAGTVYVLGDNREESYDSRNMGAIEQKALMGKVFFRIYPPTEFGRIS